MKKEIVVMENFEHLVECCGNSILIVANIYEVPKVTYSVSRPYVNCTVASWENVKNAYFCRFLQRNNAKNSLKERMQEKNNLKYKNDTKKIVITKNKNVKLPGWHIICISWHNSVLNL